MMKNIFPEYFAKKTDPGTVIDEGHCLNRKIYFQNRCTPALNIADFLAVIGRGGNTDEKIYFSPDRAKWLLSLPL